MGLRIAKVPLLLQETPSNWAQKTPSIGIDLGGKSGKILMDQIGKNVPSTHAHQSSDVVTTVEPC